MNIISQHHSFTCFKLQQRKIAVDKKNKNKQLKNIGCVLVHNTDINI